MFPLFVEAAMQQCNPGSGMEEYKLVFLQPLLKKLAWFSPHTPESTLQENDVLP